MVAISQSLTWKSEMQIKGEKCFDSVKHLWLTSAIRLLLSIMCGINLFFFRTQKAFLMYVYEVYDTFFLALKINESQGFIFIKTNCFVMWRSHRNLESFYIFFIIFAIFQMLKHDTQV